MDASLFLELTASALTIWHIKLYGDIDKRAPVVGIVASLVWAVMIGVSEQHGLWPLVIFSFLLHNRNWRLWHGK